METIAKAKMIRIAPRKTRLVINLIRGKNVNDALAILDVNNLYVKTCYVDEGPVLKRAKMDSRGHVGRNDHKLSHITIILDERQK